MRQLLFIGFILFSGNVVLAQDIAADEVPSLVLNQFNADFPNAGDIEWELENQSYHVEFELGRHKDLDAWYSKEGDLVKVKESIEKRDLPKVVLNAIEKQYPDYRIDDVAKMTSGKSISYKVELEYRRGELTKLFGADGTIIK